MAKSAYSIEQLVMMAYDGRSLDALVAGGKIQKGAATRVRNKMKESKHLDLDSAARIARTPTEFNRLLEDGDINDAIHSVLMEHHEAKNQESIKQQKEAVEKSEGNELSGDAFDYIPYLLQRALISMANNAYAEKESQVFVRDWARDFVNEDEHSLFEMIFESLSETENLRDIQSICEGISKAMTWEYISVCKIRDNRIIAEEKENQMASGYKFHRPDALQRSADSNDYPAAPQIGEEGFVPSVELVETAVMQVYVDLCGIYLAVDKELNTYNPLRRRYFLPFGYDVSGPNYNPTVTPIQTLQEAYEISCRKAALKAEEESQKRRNSLRNNKAIIERHRAKKQAAHEARMKRNAS